VPFERRQPSLAWGKGGGVPLVALHRLHGHIIEYEFARNISKSPPGVTHEISGLALQRNGWLARDRQIPRLGSGFSENMTE